MISRVYLSRRNLLTLLSKLDRKKAGEETFCCIKKFDTLNEEFPQTAEEVQVIAIEDDDYYRNRLPGKVHPSDNPNPDQPEAEREIL